MKTLKEFLVEYKMQHRAPGPPDDSPLYDISLTGTFPSDVYDTNGLRWYGNHNDRDERSAYQIIKRCHNNPNAKVKIYRACPEHVNVINSGDWVTIVENYAISHRDSRDFSSEIANDAERYHVIEQVVLAKQLFTEGYFLEWGYVK